MPNMFNIVNTIYLSDKISKEEQTNKATKLEPIGSPLKKIKSSERLRRIRSEEDFVKFQVPWIM